MIDPSIVEEVDEILDRKVSAPYKEQPLAQDWARVAKFTEEAGEGIAELILKTGQNPRKGIDPDAHDRLLMELADRAMTAVYAIQHFTKDIEQTARVLEGAQNKHLRRLRQVDESKWVAA